ncbi:SIR2 family protein [Comamonadaceae bacterium OH2545_COT-014]|nr:SIR2 family protein [Comamonadaceae bacterium OH2545_COT-014]
MGSDKFLEMVQKEFQLKGYKPALIHEHLYNLDCSITISPNFDNIYDDYCRCASSGSFVIKDHTSADIISYLNKSDVRLLIRNHGSANDPDKIIFTAEDYSKARTKYSLFYDVVRSLALTHTFLFIGCGVEDPDLRMLFEDIKFAYGRTPLHYMTTPRGETAPEVLQELGSFMQLRYMEYSPDKSHEELTQSLGELVTLVDEEREQLADRRGW